MPYTIRQKGSQWIVVSESGRTLGTHDTKDQAIKQMVAVSLAENKKPGGEM